MATPFPWLPMLSIAVGLVSHSYALTSLFPYVGYMVQSLGVTDDKDKSGQSLFAHSNCTYMRISRWKKARRGRTVLSWISFFCVQGDRLLYVLEFAPEGS